MAKYEILKARLSQFEPIFLPLEEQAGIRILERSARVIWDVELGEELDEEAVAAQIKQGLATSSDSVRQPKMRLSINLPYEAVAIPEIDQVLVKLVNSLGPFGGAQIKISFKQSPADWNDVRSFATSLRAILGINSNLEILLVAPFVEVPETEMAALFNLGVRLRFAAGWTGGQTSDQPLLVNENTLKSLSEFGFRAAIEWYVHAQNMELFQQQIESLLVANFSSGFSLPLVSQNPFYRFGSGFPQLPDALEYCQLLSDCYRRFPYFDDMLFPLNDLMLLIKDGGYHSGWHLPATNFLSVNPEGGIGVFRHSPTLALPWKTVASVTTTPAEVLKRDFSQFVNNSWRWEKLPYCRDCNWRYVCGGLDAMAADYLPSQDLDTMCAYRKLFLDHFASIRVPNFVIGAQPKI